MDEKQHLARFIPHPLSVSLESDIQHHFRNCRRVEEHVGIVGVGHGAGALFAFDAPAQLFHRLTAPERGNVIVVIA